MSMKITKKLTDGEALFIHRRRTGKTQEEMARHYKVTVDQLHLMETNVVPKDRKGTLLPIPKVKVKWMHLTAIEIAVILRKRSGLSRVQVAQQIGVSAHWLSSIEAGKVKPDKLLAHWNIAPDGTI